MRGPPAAGGYGRLVAENPGVGATGGPRLLITPTEPDATAREPTEVLPVGPRHNIDAPRVPKPPGAGLPTGK